MVCPRCHAARIEKDGLFVLCTVCGMHYEPMPSIPALPYGNPLEEHSGSAVVTH